MNKKGENKSLENPIRYNKRYANPNKLKKTKQTKNIRGGVQRYLPRSGYRGVKDTIRRI